MSAEEHRSVSVCEVGTIRVMAPWLKSGRSVVER